MKRLTLIICLSFACFLATFKISAQNFVLIPGVEFQSFLSQEYPNADTIIGGDYYLNADHVSVASDTIIEIEASDFILYDLTGIEAFTNLKVLDFRHNQVQTLPSIPSTVIYINAYGNALSSLPTLPPDLETLIVTENSNLSTLPNIPSSLKTLRCSINNMNSLPSLPNTLNILICSYNNLTSLPALPDSLKILGCGSNDLTSLPTLPNSLERLGCGGNPITVLPSLPSSLRVLDYQNSNVSVLPNLPNKLRSLMCQNNGISSIPALPDSLHTLYCRDNLLTSLPTFPENLMTLYCSNNQLTCLPTLPPNLGSLNIEGNMITCVPNYVQSTVTNAYPLCYPDDTIVNPNGCPMAHGIIGKVFKDTSNNCTDNAFGVTNIPILTINDQGDTLYSSTTNFEGVYMSSQETGTYTVKLDTANLPASVAPMCPISFEHTVTTTQAVPVIEDQDFGVECAGFDITTRAAIPSGMIFPGQTHELQILAGDISNSTNLFCASGVSGDVTVSISGPAEVITFGGSPTIINDSTAAYYIPDFGTHPMDSIKLLIKTDTTATITDSFTVTTYVSNLSEVDMISYNDTAKVVYPVTNSYDPNKKEVYPAQVKPNYNSPLMYTVYFQNTGNAPAINVRLEDFLDPKLNLSTFRFLDASHYQTHNIDYNTRMLTIRYPNINLQDSTTDFLGSIGYFRFQINPVNYLPNGTSIGNYVSIYFDFNSLINTNTAVCNFVSLANLDEQSTNKKIRLYPNPASQTITVEADDPIQQVIIYAPDGQSVLTKQMQSKQSLLDLSHFPSGIYFMHIAFKGSREVVKFIKE